MHSQIAAHTFVALFVVTLVLTGCDAAEPAADAQGDPAVVAPIATQRWELISDPSQAALVLLGEGDRQQFHLACLDQPPRMTVLASDFTVIGSEERLTLGAADEAFGFVADVERVGPGVQAEGAIDPSFLEHLTRSADISAVYGAQQVGPYPAPPSDQTAAFVAACRAIQAG